MQLPGTWLEDEKGNPYGICSMAELIFLSNGQTVEDRLTGNITINGDVNYNTEEQLTGKRWIDGKPIYQKSFNESVKSSASDWVSNGDLSDLNIDNFLNILGTVLYTDGKIFPINSGYLAMAYNPSTKSMIVTQTSMGNNYTWNVKYTILYTKTTDTASSPIKTMQLKPMINYSTEEQVIGTWIDGKPLYQRTFFGVQITQNQENFVGDNFGDKKLIHFQIDFTGLSNNLTSANNYSDTLFINANNQLIYYFFRNGTWWAGFNTADITVQYTKTTDTIMYIGPNANSYTLDEKVVGYWTDGKPIYQKTFTNLSIAVRAGEWDKVVELDNPENAISCDLYRVGGEGQIVHVSIRDFTIGAAGYTNCLTITAFDSYTIVMATIQYTKKTD